MRREDLEEVIEGFLKKIATTLRFNPASKGRYQFLEGTGYTDVRNQIFRRDRVAVSLMKPEMFRKVREALGKVRADNGEPILSSGDMERLDRAWEHYQEDTLTAPSRIPKHWSVLVAKHDIHPSRMGTADDIHWLFYPILYAPMLRHDVATFNQNNKALLSALSVKDGAFPFQKERLRLVWEAYLLTAAFCHHRLEQKREQNACIVEMKRLQKDRASTPIGIELFAHAFYQDRSSIAASRALKLARAKPVPEGWTCWQGFETGRAGIAAILRGQNGFSPSDELEGVRPIDAIRACRDAMQGRGVKGPELFFEMSTCYPAVMAGDVDFVYEKSSEVLVRCDNELGGMPHLTDYAKWMRGVTHYQAARGSRYHLVRARECMDSLSNYFQTVGGREGEIRDAIRAATRGVERA